MARGWGRSEEDLEADKEELRQARARAAQPSARDELQEAARRRGIEQSLARIEEQLSQTENPGRRLALEAARRELLEKLAPGSPGRAPAP